MKKKTKISLVSALSLLGVASIFGFGFLCGILSAVDPTCDTVRKLSERHDKIQLHTESYDPSCEELKNKEIPKIVRQNNDFFFVNVSNDYYHVFGINVDPSEQPVLFWWGAELESTLEQKCAEQISDTID